MDSQSQVNSKKCNLDIVELDLYSVKITISGELSMTSLLEIESYFSKGKENKHTVYVILDLKDFVSLTFEVKQYVYGKNFFPEKGFKILVYGLKDEYNSNLQLLFHNDSNINVFDFENESQALTKAKELSNRSKMDALAIGPSSFTGIIKKNIKIKDKDLILIHDKSWNYKHPSDTYYYNIDLIDANVFVSRPAGYIEFENSLSANVLFDKVVYKLMGTEGNYYRIQDYTEVMSTSLAARRDFTNYIINNVNRIDLMVFFGLNSFMKAIVKFGKLIHPKFYKVKLADSLEEALTLVLNHKYGDDYFSDSIKHEEEQLANEDTWSELKALRKENEDLKSEHRLGKKKLLEAIGGVLWSDDFEMENALDSPRTGYSDLYNALKVLKQDINEINQKRSSSTKQLLHQTQVLTKEIKDYKDLANQSDLRKQDYFNVFNFEIRSPFQSILSNVELLTRIDKTVEHKEIISQLNESSLLINKRLKKHFEVDSRSNNTNELSSMVFNIDKTIQLIMKANLENTASKGLELIYEKDEQVPSYLIGDEDKIRLIIEQFVDNAIYFTNQGNIIIRTKLIEDYETSAKILIEVEDTGIGMTREKFERLSDNVGIKDNEEVYVWQNHGVGLTILKQLAVIINGEIEMKRAENNGSIFSIQIKLNKGVFSKEMNLKPRNMSRSLISTKLKDKNILFVTADSSLESVYLSQFKQIGVPVKFANNETHALSLLKFGKFDFIFIEAPIDESEGIRLLEQIYETLDFQLETATKIVFVMSFPDSDLRDQILKKGCSATINKPYQIIELKKLLESLSMK